MNRKMKKLLWILGLSALLPTLASKMLVANKALVDLECYEEKGKTFYRGVWTKGTGGQTLKSYATAEEFETDAKGMLAGGGALRDIAIKETSDGPQVVAVYDKGAATTELVRWNSWDEFETDWKEKQKAGMQVIDFDFYSYLGEEVFYGIYRKQDKQAEYFISPNWTEMSEHITAKGAKKYEVQDVDRAMINGSWHYIVFFNEGEKPLEYKAFKVTSNEAVERQAGANAQKGIILIEADGFTQNNAVTHLTIYVKQPQPNGLFTSENWEDFEKKFLEWN